MVPFSIIFVGEFCVTIYIDLFTLQSRLKQGVESLFPKRVWI